MNVWPLPLIPIAGWMLLPWALSALVFAAEPPREQPRPEPACQLILEGKRVERLTLTDPAGQTLEIVHPGPRVSLPAGHYRIQEICVQWDQSGTTSVEKDVNWLTLSPDRPCHLDIGSLDTPRVLVTRHGRTLSLDCQNVKRGANGPPQFAIYQGDRQVISGAFEYG